MERAMKLAQRRNSLPAAGTATCSTSFNDFSNGEIVAKASRLDISLGGSPSEVDASVEVLRHIENERSLTMLRKNIDLDIGPDSLVIHKASNLSEDLEDEEEEEAQEHQAPVVFVQKTKRSRTSKGASLLNVRRSARIKKIKNK